MIDNIKKYNEGKAKGQTSLQISDDLIIVLFRKDYELDNSTYPPTVVEKADQVEYTTDMEKIDAQISLLTEQLDILTAFKAELEPQIEKVSTLVKAKLENNLIDK